MSDAPSPPHEPERYSGRVALERLLDRALPRRLRCFDSDQEWRAFLLVVHDSGDKVVRRQDTGKWAGQRKVIPVFAPGARSMPCDDCDPAFKRRMVEVGRCERVSPGNAARRWLRAVLLPGPLLASEVQQMAREQGFRQRTIYRAAKRVGVLKRRLDPSEPQTAVWSLSTIALAPLLIAKFLQARNRPAHSPAEEGDL